MQIKILNCRPFFDGFLIYFISGLFKPIHFHVCAFEEEINKKKTHFLFSSFFLCMDIVTCPLLEGDMIIPLYTSFNLEQ